NHNNIAPIQKKDVLNVKMSNLINKSEYKTMINNEIITRDEPPWNFEYPKKEWVKRLGTLVVNNACYRILFNANARQISNPLKEVAFENVKENSTILKLNNAFVVNYDNDMAVSEKQI
ncbi:hypothetical protein A3Q56_03298, partial [Intoshia linei]